MTSKFFYYHSVEYIKLDTCAKFQYYQSNNNKVKMGGGPSPQLMVKKSPCQIGLTIWLVSRVRLPGTLTDSDMSDVFLQCLRSISAVMKPLDHGLLVFALASQNKWNVPSEIIPTWDMRNNYLLHDICRS